MSGYLEVKYPFKSSLGLNPFKSWKRQWCILRPSPTRSGASLAVYCSEAGASAGSVELPLGCVVRRAKSRSRPHAFAVFSVDDPRKPRVLLAAQTLHDAQLWMEKISVFLNDNKVLDAEPLLKDCFSVTVVATALSRKCGLHSDTLVTLTKGGVLVGRSQQLGAFVEWKHVSDVHLTSEGADRNTTCVISIDNKFARGGGELRLWSPLSRALCGAVRGALRGRGVRAHALSRSDGDLRTAKCSDAEMGDVGRSSWYSGPSEVSLDDIDLVMSKESKHIPSGVLSRCAGGELADENALYSIASCDDDSMSDRRSLLSVASGIYEEIPDLPDGGSNKDCAMSQDVPDGVLKMDARREEPTYESVSECVYGTLRRGARRRPPPLPPRTLHCTLKPAAAWAGRACSAAGVTRHSSLGSLPRCCAAPHDAFDGSRTLPKLEKRQPFSVFRKRLKSDSRANGAQKTETSKENKDVETKKKKFEFTPTRDIFKSFKVSRKMKNLKITAGSLGKGETKSCEFLDDAEHAAHDRCSKSVDCLENDFDFETDLSIEFSEDTVAALSLPQEIVELILGHDQMNKVRRKEEAESHYMPMSPIIPPPLEHHYMVMSPRTNIA